MALHTEAELDGMRRLHQLVQDEQRDADDAHAREMEEAWEPQTDDEDEDEEDEDEEDDEVNVAREAARALAVTAVLSQWSEAADYVATVVHRDERDPLVDACARAAWHTIRVAQHDPRVPTSRIERANLPELLALRLEHFERACKASTTGVERGAGPPARRRRRWSRAPYARAAEWS
jgi:hypothetical protein